MLKRTEWREETKQMRFEDAYSGWSVKYDYAWYQRAVSKKQDPELFGKSHQTPTRQPDPDPASRRLKDKTKKNPWIPD